MDADRKLLEDAARAAGIVVIRSRLDDPMNRDMLVENGARNTFHEFGPWNSLTDDGDALRLAVKLNLLASPSFWHEQSCELTFAGMNGDRQDPCAATRRAITRAAAQLAQAAQAKPGEGEAS